MGKNRSLMFLGLRYIFGLGIISLYFIISGLVASDDGQILIGLSAFPVLLVLIYQQVIKEYEIFTPLNFLWVNLLFGVFLQSIYFIYLDQGESKYGLYSLSNMEELLFASIVITISIVFFLIGYSFRTGRGRAKDYDLFEYFSPKRLRVISTVVLAVSLVSLLSYISIFDISADLARISSKRRIYGESIVGNISHSYLIWGASISQTGFLVLYCYRGVLKQSDSFIPFWMNSYLVIFGVLALLLPFLNNQRTPILVFLISTAVLNHYVYKRWSLHRIRVIVILALVFLVVMGALRYVNGRSSSVFSYYIENAGIPHIVTTIAGSGNFLSLGKTSVILSSVPEALDHTYGATYGLWLLSPVPRSIWEEKPIVRIGGVLGPAIFNTTTRSGVPPGFVGEVHLNFGLFGLPMMLIILGFGMRFFYERYGKSSSSSWRSALIYSALYTHIYFNFFSTDFTAVTLGVIKVMLPMLLILRLSKRYFVR